MFGISQVIIENNNNVNVHYNDDRERGREGGEVRGERNRERENKSF